MPQEGGYAPPAAPKLGREIALALLGLLQGFRIVGSMDLNRVAEAVSAHQIQSIIHFGPPGPVTISRQHVTEPKASPD